MHNPLEYELRLQQYIELVRQRETPRLKEAILHARKYLKHSDPTCESQMEAAGLLAFPPNTQTQPYKVCNTPIVGSRD